MRSDEELLALAWQVGRGCLLEAEGEYERQRKLIDKLDSRVVTRFKYSAHDFDGAVRAIWIGDIEIGPDRRPVDPDSVAKMAQSIEMNGLLHPIMVRMQPDDILQERDDAKSYILIAGRHRLEAIRRLGAFHAPCQVIKADGVGARILEITENLRRTDLSQLERAEHETEWMQLTEARLVVEGKLSETREGRPGVSAAVAAETGLSPKRAQRSVKVAALSPEAKAAAVDTGLDDNQSALLAAAKETTPERQVEVLRQRVEQEPERKEDRAKPTDDVSPKPRGCDAAMIAELKSEFAKIEHMLPEIEDDDGLIERLTYLQIAERYRAVIAVEEAGLSVGGKETKAIRDRLSGAVSTIWLIMRSKAGDDPAAAAVVQRPDPTEPFEVPKFLRRDIEAA